MNTVAMDLPPPQPTETHLGHDTMTTEQVLQVRDLTVSFDGFRAVDGLSLSVEKNELRVIIGPTGPARRPCWT